MNKILTTNEAAILSSKINKTSQKIVLAGGCFDILHIGHIQFLNEAKTKGDALFVMLEHDAGIKKRKGQHRPLNNQPDRAALLAALEMVDAVILMPEQTTDVFYDELVNQIKPAIIATTAGDAHRKHKERQAKQVGAQVVDVIQPVLNKSTTKLFTILNEL